MSSIGNSHTCQNCGHSFEGPFCNMCSQKADTHRFTLKHLVHEIPHSVFHVEKGFFYTMRELTKNPGQTIRNFIGGKRVRYFPPLTYFLLLVGFSFFLSGVLHIYDKTFATSSLATKTNPLGNFFNEENITTWSKYFFYILIPLTSFVIYLIYKRSKTYNYTEHTVANLYIYGHRTIVSILLTFLYVLINPGTAALISTIFDTLIAAWMYGELYEPQQKKLNRFLIGLGIYIISIVVAMLALLTFIFLVTIVFVLIKKKIAG
jgi:hypothetical protein